MEPVTIVLGRVSRGGDYADGESNWAANKRTGMGFRRGLPVARSGLRVPQDCAPAEGPGNLHDTQQCVQAIAQAGYLKRLN